MSNLWFDNDNNPDLVEVSLKGKYMAELAPVLSDDIVMMSRMNTFTKDFLK